MTTDDDISGVEIVCLEMRRKLRSLDEEVKQKRNLNKEFVFHFFNIQCVFFIELKVFVNLTYLYLSEIKKQGLIFSVGKGHLIIFKKKIRSRQRIFI